MLKLSLGAILVVGVMYILLDATYGDTTVINEVPTEVETKESWMTDEEAIQAAKDVIKKKELEAKEAELETKIKELETELTTVQKELGTY